MHPTQSSSLSWESCNPLQGPTWWSVLCLTVTANPHNATPCTSNHCASFTGFPFLESCKVMEVRLCFVKQTADSFILDTVCSNRKALWTQLALLQKAKRILSIHAFLASLLLLSVSSFCLPDWCLEYPFCSSPLKIDIHFVHVIAQLLLSHELTGV